MHASLLSSSLFVLLSGCLLEGEGGAEGDADAEVEAEEAADDDGDGLTNSEEAELGTDPTLADSDGDGFSDPDELEVGTSPTWEWSHLYEEGDYLIGDCPTHPDADSVGPTGVGTYGGTTWEAYQEGDVLDNFKATDRFGQEVTPYAHCGNYTLVVMSAEWCGPCQALADLMTEDTEEIRETYPNFTFYEFLYQDNYGAEPDEDVLRSWVRSFDLEGIPVVAPNNNRAAWINHLNASGGIPATLLLAPDMTVIWSAVDHPGEYYLYDAASILDALDAYAGR